MKQSLRIFRIVPVAVSCLWLVTSISLAAISAQDLRKIEEAVPQSATVKPFKARKLLVFTRARGLQHSSIPYGTKALELMAHQTGAFEMVVSEDMAIFTSDRLQQFDAICFNNSNRMDFTEPALRQGLMDFVNSGKGVVGIHAATTNFSNKNPVNSVDWPQAAEMIGGIFAGHHWRSSQGEWAVKIDDPDHPLNAAFGAEGFKIADEIYFYSKFQKDKVRVLLSLDFNDAKTASMKKDQTYVPISWVRDWGKGRVFYCSLGHDHHIFWNPALLRHLLDGIQFALGDLPVDTTPTVELQKVLRRAHQHKVITEDWGTLSWVASKPLGNAEGLTVGRATIKAGHTNPRHRHPKSEEVLYLLKGHINHTLDDKTITMSAGDVVTIAPGVFHNAACIGNEDAEMIVVYSQGTRRFELEQSPAAQTPVLRKN